MALSVASGLPTRHNSEQYADLQVETGFPHLQNDAVLRAALGEIVSPTPVWVMRQAGRYLPEFQAVRADHDFFSVCRTPELACEVTLQPIRRFPLDAAIIFSDILVVPQAMGMEVVMTAGIGPQFPHPLDTPEDLGKLKHPELTRDFGEIHAEPYFDSIYLTRHSLCGKVPLFGFAGGPFTLLAYMIEGGGSEAFTKTRRWMQEWPAATHQLLTLLTDIIGDFLLGQVCAGAQILQVFESHAGVLSKSEFAEFSLPYLTRVAARLRRSFPQLPTVVFARGANDSLEELMQTDFSVIGIDWQADILQAKSLALRYHKTLQGSLSPKVLHLTPSEISQQTRDMMQLFVGVPHIANLGHGVEPTTDTGNFAVFVQSVHQFTN